jgi:hypothetical protein
MTWLDDLTLDTVIVHTTDGMSFKGLKSSVYDDCLVLREARVLEDDGMSKILDGEVAVPRERVHFVQVLASPGDA